MSIGLLFWFLWIIWLVFGLWWNYTPGVYGPVGGHLLQWIMFGLLGWGVFGPPIHG